MTRVVLTVGRLVRQKGHRLLIEAIDDVMRTRPDVVHIIVGDGPERGALATQIRRLDREGTIRLVGRQEQEVLEVIIQVVAVEEAPQLMMEE